MSRPPRDLSPGSTISRLTGERDQLRAECRMLEQVIDLLVNERARLIEQLAGLPSGNGLSPVLPLREFLENPRRILQLAERHGGVVVLNEQGEVCVVVRQPPGLAPASR